MSPVYRFFLFITVKEFFCQVGGQKRLKSCQHICERPLRTANIDHCIQPAQPTGWLAKLYLCSLAQTEYIKSRKLLQTMQTKKLNTFFVQPIDRWPKLCVYTPSTLRRALIFWYLPRVVAAVKYVLKHGLNHSKWDLVGYSGGSPGLENAVKRWGWPIGLI